MDEEQQEELPAPPTQVYRDGDWVDVEPSKPVQVYRHGDWVTIETSEPGPAEGEE